jgi:hypothetical protein
MGIKISKGNSKIGNIPNISLVPIKDCGNCSACKTKCYALKAYRQYPGVRNAWNINSEAFRKDPWEATNEVLDFINKHDSKYFRIHVAGDFLNQDHFNAWENLCAIKHDCHFMVNTKMFDLNYAYHSPNMHIRFSMWPGQLIPESYMPKAWVQDGSEMRIPADAIECAGNCDKCLVCYETNKDVFFHIH